MSRIRSSAVHLASAACCRRFIAASLAPRCWPPGRQAAEKTTFKVAWSIYVGWMPWDYAQPERHPEEVGRQVRHQDRAHADQRLRRVHQPVHRRQVRRLRDDQHGHADDSGRGRRGLHRADRRRLSPTATTAWCSRARARSSPTSRASRSTWSSCRCRTTCWRAASRSVGLRERDIKVVNTSDADIVGAFATPARHRDGDLEAAAGRGHGACPTATLVFDSSKIPGEILDLMVVNSDDAEGQSRSWARRWSAPGTKPWRVMQAKDAQGHDRARRRWPRPPAPISRASTASSRPPTCSATPAAARWPSPRSPDLRHEDGPGAQVLLRARPAGRGRQDRRCRRHRVPRRQDAGQCKAIIKLRFDPSYMQLAADGKL